jgi:SAM-dependent methyltransferase
MCSTESDPWLTAWMPRLRSLSLEEPVLELGCGKGRDTTTLCAGGLAVVATDISRASLQQCAKGARRASAVQMDLREPFPFRAMSFRVIVASLSLHYFSWTATRGAVDEIARCIRPGGLLLARFNSTNDIHHGAGVGDEIERHLFRVGVRQKRFFDRADVVGLLAGWRIERLAEKTIQRYEKPKVVWEVVALGGA